MVAVADLLDQAARLMRDYGLHENAARDAIMAATYRAARRWPADPAAIDPESDSEFIAAVLAELELEARRRAH